MSRALTTGLLAAALTAALAPAPAHASAGASGGYQTRTLGRCTAYGSSGGFGVVCSGGGGTTIGLRELLQGDPVPPRCWHELPPPEFVPPPAPQPGPGRWWLETCLDGIDRDTLLVGPDGLQLSYTYRWLPPGGERRLTERQVRFVDAYVQRGQVQLPYPLLVVSPSASPRVGETVAFSLSGPATTRVLVVGGIRMRAGVVALTVEPEGAGGPRTTCTGTGRALRAEDLATVDLDDQGDDVCAYRYGRSSAGAGDGSGDPDRYPARVTASWRVVIGDGDVLGTFDKQAVNELRVAEVQTLVVTGRDGS